ncbi:diguanylate cyclase [Candidatus Gracilibacteria bacterium]|nr:diguanylate cyclase [Candidatus Gracilibacteria bacterium]
MVKPHISLEIEQRATKRDPKHTKKSIESIHNTLQEQSNEIERLRAVVNGMHENIALIDNEMKSYDDQICENQDCNKMSSFVRDKISFLLQLKEKEFKNCLALDVKVKEAENELRLLKQDHGIASSVDVGTRIRNKIGAYDVLYHRFLLAESDESLDTMLTYIDLDNFSRYNDNGEHKLGDKILKLFTTTINQLIHQKYRKKAAICRLGGDEFLLISNLSMSEQKSFLQQAQKLVLEQGYLISKYPVTFTAGISNLKKACVDTCDMLIMDAMAAHIDNVDRNSDITDEQRDAFFETKINFVNHVTSQADQICGIGKERVGKGQIYTFEDVQQFIPKS